MGRRESQNGGWRVRAEIARAKRELTPDQWEAILVGVSDDGEIAAYPCRLVLPFHYPATIEELDEYGPDHFTFPQDSWKLRWEVIPEFAEEYAEAVNIEDDAEELLAEKRHRQRRIEVLQRSLKFLGRELPHVEVVFSHFLDG